MRKISALLYTFILTVSSVGQTLNVHVGNIVYQFPARQVGEMTYADGTTVSIMGKTFTLNDISYMTVDESEVRKTSPELGIDANTEGGKKLYVTGGTIVAIGGLESGSSLTQTCYSASSWSKNTWYSFTNGDQTFAFKTPASGGSTLVVSASSKPTIKSNVTVSGGTSIFSGMGNVNPTISGGSSVTLSTYSGGGGRW